MGGNTPYPGRVGNGSEAETLPEFKHQGWEKAPRVPELVARCVLKWCIEGKKGGRVCVMKKRALIQGRVLAEDGRAFGRMQHAKGGGIWACLWRTCHLAGRGPQGRAAFLAPRLGTFIEQSTRYGAQQQRAGPRTGRGPVVPSATTCRIWTWIATARRRSGTRERGPVLSQVSSVGSASFLAPTSALRGLAPPAFFYSVVAPHVQVWSREDLPSSSYYLVRAAHVKTLPGCAPSRGGVCCCGAAGSQLSRVLCPVSGADVPAAHAGKGLI